MLTSYRISLRIILTAALSWTASLILFTSAASAQGSINVNPLITYKQQLKELNRDCASNPHHPNCVEMRKRLKNQIDGLRDICRNDPSDERCGAILKEKRNPGWHAEQKCIKNPHSKMCVRRRMRKKWRDKRRRIFCKKNPEAKRCFAHSRRRPKWNVVTYCKSHPEKMVCKKLDERRRASKPKKEEPENTF